MPDPVEVQLAADEAEARDFLQMMGLVAGPPMAKPARPKAPRRFAPPAPRTPRRRPSAARRCALYRHYDADGVLLYVGVTVNPRTRTRTHCDQSLWVPFAAYGTIEWFDSITEAVAAERAAIENENPVFNQQHSHRGYKRRLNEYLSAAKRGGAPV